jgi:ferritin
MSKYLWPSPNEKIKQMKTKSCRRLSSINMLIGEAHTQEDYKRISFLLKRHHFLMEQKEKEKDINTSNAL